MSERIQKALATAGIASRREIERLIAEGRILVNGRPAEIGQHIDHDDQVRVDGRPVALQRKAEAARVLIYKKRVGEVVTRDDPEGRRTVFRKLPKLEQGRWIAVGRLDINTSGLLLFTNHGELARRLTHPSFEISREYAVRVHGPIDEALVQRLTTGVELDDGPARFDSMRPAPGEDGEASNLWYTVTLREGRNREVRRLFESQRLQVSRLIRVRYGPIELGRGIKSATAREATPAEVHALMVAVKLEDAQAAGPGKRPARAPKRSSPASAKPVRAAESSRFANRSVKSTRAPKPAQDRKAPKKRSRD
ncbi:MAG: pseudouridine synthase [Sinimarinibacterium sp.]|jgi:23S rRNA pseudouridine2605 synthase